MWLLVIVAAWAAGVGAGELAASAGGFRFQGTDYYYPNFYAATGVRGGVSYAVGDVNRSTVRFLAQAWPMDDNIFDPALEYAWRRKLAPAGWEILAEPTAGFGYTKLQYPRPYYWTVEWHFLPWLRGGADLGVGHRVTDSLSARVGWRGRALYYLGDWHYTLRDDRLRFVQAPQLELRWAPQGRWAYSLELGWEFGGFYDDLFLPPSYLDTSRPYAEVGVAYRL